MRFRVFAHVVFAAATMASELLGASREFDPAAETLTVYAERLDQFFVANKIGIVPIDASAAITAAAENKEVAVLISVIGWKTYNLTVLRELCSPGSQRI